MLALEDTGRAVIFNAPVDLILDEHHKGRRDHSFPLWALLILELWHRRYIDHSPRTVESSEPSALPVTV